jgi:protein ImuB
MRRVACIALPQIRIEIAREDENVPLAQASPPEGRGLSPSPRERESDAKSSAKDLALLAVVIARPGGSVGTSRDILGNTRLDVVSREARASGVRAGQTVAAARAKCATLRVRVVAESAVRAGLARVAEVALAFGPSTSFDVATDVVWVEIGGCAHLHGGEGEFVQALEGRVRALGHACRVSIADGPRIAAAIARFGMVARPGRPRAASRECATLIVPEGKGAEAMRALPVEALGMGGEDESLAVWFRDLGLRTCGDLQDLPRRSLGTRLGGRTKDVMHLLGGEDRAPLDAWRPPEVPEERAELEWGASSVEALAFVTKALCDRLAARLEGRAMAAARVGLVLDLDRALLGEGASPSLGIDVTLPVPIVRAADLLAVIRTRLERLELPAPVLAVTLRALELSTSRPHALDLLAPEPKAERTLTPLVAELTADLGPACVGTLALADSWSPDERTRLMPFGAKSSDPPHVSVGAADVPFSLVTSAIEPSRLVHSSRPISRPLDSFEEPTLLARLEAVEWWRRRSTRRDFYAAWDGAGLAWVEVRSAETPRAFAGEEGAGEAGMKESWIRGWID